MTAILMFQNNETAAMLLYQTNPVGVQLFSYKTPFLLFCSKKFSWLAAGHMSAYTLYCKLTQMTIQMVQMYNGCYYCGRYVLSRETLSSQIILVYTDKSVMLKMRTKKQN